MIGPFRNKDWQIKKKKFGKYCPKVRLKHENINDIQSILDKICFVGKKKYRETLISYIIRDKS